MDIEEGIRTLASWFGNRQFTVADILGDDRIWDIVELIGANTLTPHGRRTQLGKRLAALDGRRCPINDNRDLMFCVIERANGSKAAIYQIREILHPRSNSI